LSRGTPNAGDPFAQLAGKGHSAATIERYLAILGSPADNVSLPEGSPLSPRLFLIERACRWLVWALPLASLALGGSMLMLVRRRQPG
jgi:hypothetical protein